MSTVNTPAAPVASAPAPSVPAAPRPDQLTERLGLGVDRVMAESGLWAPRLAALAFRQARGDVTRAVQLLRTHRTSLPRLGRSLPVRSGELRVVRRISSAFRNPPGGQVLGRTLDYVGRLLDLLPEEEGRQRAVRASESAHGHHHHHGHGHDGHAHPPHGHEDEVERAPGHVLSVFREMDIAAPPGDHDDPEPYDITRHPARPGVPRSALLQTMARADTGALLYLWYGSDWKPGGQEAHEVPGELRHGFLPVRVEHPHTGRPVTVGDVRVSEVVSFHSLTRAGELPRHLDVGYGMCFGHNERKAISMAGVDILLGHHEGTERAAGLQHDVLLTLDGVDITGYAEHQKLPHHAEYRSVLERATAAAAHQAGPRRTHSGDTA
jgi:alpha-D-ribose 1-methylphosphonate 5-triphosphate synthase subunit PhnI